MNDIILKLSQQEATILIQLLDLAVKGSGISVAEAAVVFAKRIEEASRLAATEVLEKAETASKSKSKPKVE